MTNVAFELQRPARRDTSVVFASPHSSCAYPADFLSQIILNDREVRTSEDAFVDDLYAAATEQGAPLLMAGVPRAYLDLNRGAEELDPALIKGVRRTTHNPRVASGLGVIPRVVANGRAIYHGKIELDEAHRRISQYWRPYHDRLQSLLDEAHREFGDAVLIDCHSMPSEALDNVGPPGEPKPDVVLGDRFGAAAASSVTEQVEAAFTRAGLRVARNMPFAGAYTTQHYGRPSRHQHVVQVEINRALYMDEASLTPHADYAAFKARIAGVVADIAAIGRKASLPVAAE